MSIIAYPPGYRLMCFKCGILGPMGKLSSGRAWAYVGAGLGGAVSVGANIAHSYVPPAGAPPEWHPAGGAIAFAAFWPMALLVTIEVLARNRWPAGAGWALLRFGGLLPAAAVAAVVSYRHLSSLLAYYGDDKLAVVIGPAAVDWIIIICTGALMATARHRATPTPAPAPRATAPAAPAAPARPVAPPTAPVPATPPPPAPRPAVRRATRATEDDPVVAYLAKHPGAKTTEIHDATGVPRRTVDRRLAALRAAPAAPPAHNGADPHITIGATP